MLERFFEKIFDWHRVQHMDDLDWITQNRLIMQKHQKTFRQAIEKNSRKNDRKRILFWSTGAWERGGVEYMLAFALRLRGHDVHGVYCDGGFKSCSMESEIYPRPDCEYCKKRSERMLAIFRHHEICNPISEFLSKNDLLKCEEEISALSKKEMIDFTWNGIPIGRNTLRDLPQYYFRLIELNDIEVLERYKMNLISTYAYTVAAENAVRSFQPEHAIVTSGKTVAYGSFYETCKKHNVPVVTWDESVGGIDAFIFDTDEVAVMYRKNKAWKKIMDEPLTEEEMEFSSYYFGNTAVGKFGRQTYYHNPITDEETILKNLQLTKHKPILTILTNLPWDTSALGRDIAFESMLDWIYSTVDFFLEHNEAQLVIRTHPAEGHAPKYARGTSRVSELIYEKYPDLPNHIKVIGGSEEINSHKLCELSDAIAVYATNVALEMAMRGRKVMVCGDSHYRNKGFTMDINTREEYFDLIESGKIFSDKTIPDSSSKKAIKYGYFFIVRIEAYLPEFHHESRHVFSIPEPEEFLPSKSMRWDKLCDNVLEKGDFVDCTEYIDPWKVPAKK